MTKAIKKILNPLSKRCTWLAHKKYLMYETRTVDTVGRAVIIQHYRCSQCGHEWCDKVEVDPTYQIDFHEI